VSASDESLELTQPSFKFSNISPARLDNSNDKTLQDIENLRKIFAKNPNFCVSDFQGLIAEDGQFYVMDPRDVDLHTGSMNNFFELDALQGFIIFCIA
jgi:DNA/RNA endonuclease G (NUC1)